MSRRERRANLIALLLGLVATAAVIGLYLVGGLDWLEFKTLDLRFRYANSIPQDPRIVCVDIDDEALDLVGRWPWARDVQAGVISILAELDADALLYDITLTETEPVRSIPPRQMGIATDPLELGTAGAGIAYPDHELRTAIADAGRVYLAFDYATEDEQADAQSDESGPVVAALRPRIRAWLDAEPGRWHAPTYDFFDRLDTELLGPASRHREGLAVALREVLSCEATTRAVLVPLEQVRAAARPVDAISPVYFPHARAAKRCGFVVFKPDTDGVMRRMRLLVEHKGRVLPQLAFAVAFDSLGLRAEDVSAAAGRLVLRGGDAAEPLVVQLDDEGQTLVPWVTERDWTRQFGEHVPVGAVWQIYDRRQSIQHNNEVVLTMLGELLEAGHLGQHRQYRDDLKRRLELESERRLARYRDDPETAAFKRQMIAEYDQVLPEDERKLRADLAGEIARVSASPGLEDRDELRVYLDAAEEMQRAFTANVEYREEIETSLGRLRGRVEGKICVLGYTATSLADMTPIPTHPRAPGVIAHANLLNGLLTGRLVYWAPAWGNALLAGLAGVLVSLVSVWRRPRAVGLLVVALIVVLVGVAGWWAFYIYTYWIALTPAVGAMLTAYFTIAVYRYMFVERERRQLTTALSQYTSATLARKMAEDAELCRRAETREVTAMFTDLRNFTTISERIGAERTQRVLNICLGRCSEVMLWQEAMINKFIGDGIFAFWNPVIYPQLDHARRACETTVALQAALRQLAAEQHSKGGDEVFAELVLRVGVASGPAVVGPCGSEQKYDYTCIGDTVNVAARLESANKFYGTRILVSGTTREQVGEEFTFRPLGGVRVKGKVQPVPIYELLGRAGEVPDELCEYAGAFGQAVKLFQQQKWPATSEAFTACHRQRPDDLAAERYLETIAQFSAQPPPEDWGGAIELTEK